MSRKSWAAGDACQRAVNLALKVSQGQSGVPTVLSAPVWGFYDVLFKGKKFEFQREYGSYVMENVLFKVSYPAEFHSQTAIECAQKVNKVLKDMGKTAEDIKEITCRTHEACIRIIDKQFKAMDNFADRDHCVQYMVATMLVFNRLEATDYLDGSEAATSPLLEDLRKRIKCVEDPQFTKDYHDPNLRTISNALTVTLNDGTVLDEVVVEAPLGHRLRRDEAKPEIVGGMSPFSRKPAVVVVQPSNHSTNVECSVDRVKNEWSSWNSGTIWHSSSRYDRTEYSGTLRES